MGGTEKSFSSRFWEITELQFKFTGERNVAADVQPSLSVRRRKFCFPAICTRPRDKNSVKNRYSNK